MVTSRVVSRNEVQLNDVRFPILGPVRATVASQYPAKIVIGDITKDSHPRVSTIAWNSFERGFGLERTGGQKAEDLEKVFFAEGITLFPGHLVLPFEQTGTGSPAGSGNVSTVGERGAVIYGTRGTDVSTWSGSSWSVSAHTLGAAATDVEHFFLAGTEYIAWATTSGYTYYNGSSYTNDTTDAVYLAYWDDRLWGIDTGGQLWYSSTIGTEVNDAILQLPSGYVTALFVGPDASGNDILYAATQAGLYAHDAANARFVRTHVTWPKNANGGLGATTWRGRIYVSTGSTGILEYDPQSGFVRAMGPDQDSGLPSSYRDGNINFMVGSHLWLLIGMASATNRHVYAWNTTGWSVISTKDTSNDLGPLLVSDAVSSYRLYFVAGTVVKRMELPDSTVSPDENSALRWETSAVQEDTSLPYFDAGQANVDKLAIRLHVEVTGASSTSTVVAGYVLNYVGSHTNFATIIADGTTTFDFQTNSENSGVAFRAIRIRLRLANDTSTDTPDIRSVTLEFRKKLPTTYGFQFDVDLSKPYKENESVSQMRANLISTLESNIMTEFTYRDNDGGTQNYFVDVVNIESLEETGLDETGTMRVTVAEL